MAVKHIFAHFVYNDVYIEYILAIVACGYAVRGAYSVVGQVVEAGVLGAWPQNNARHQGA
ncbi:hypothetical protein [Roseovarius sp.]|uniref:hypothetical protein n=1 Tax=Roseovarius sp. TaxID=1486281 RepID=UPI003515677D